MNLTNLIPGIQYAKLAGIVGIVAVAFFGYRFITNYVAKAEATRDAYIASEIENAQKQARIEWMGEKEKIVSEFHDEKIRITEQYLAERQARLDDQEENIEFMGSASKMAEVAEAENEFSRGNERLTFRAKRATEEISDEIETLSRHNSLYESVDPVIDGN